MNRFAAVHQFHPVTAQGDAITQQMLELQRHLRQMGLNSQIFAAHVEARLQDGIRPIQSYAGSPDNLLLVHHSQGNPGLDEVCDLPDEIAPIYHNLTPERYFSDPEFLHLIRLGHQQLTLLSHRSRVGIAVSNYNRREMLEVGFRRVEVLPVRVDYEQFARVAAESPFESTDWLYVGRIVGNKCQHELVQAFAMYSEAFDNEARLVLIGDTAVSDDYADFVRNEAVRMGIADRVVMLGKVSDRQLVSAFASAGVFVSMSEHEGFGVPIVEAMAAGLPVVAFGAAAVPEVMGGAGILLRDKAPEVVAATVQAIRADPAMRNRLIERQFVRVDQIERFDVPGLLERVIERASGNERPLEVQIQGPFETSSSVALLNREIACGLDRLPDRNLSIYATEGGGDYRPEQAGLDQHPGATDLFQRSSGVPYPDVVIRQMYPPRVIDSPGAITVEYFGWEESLIPPAMADDFNRYLSGVGVTSNFVRQVLTDSGVEVPICVVGIGVPAHDQAAKMDAPELEGLRSFCFLNISSALFRQGTDVLLKSYFSEFDGSEDVTLILKSFPNPRNHVGELLKDLRAKYPNPPDVKWIDRDLDDREITSLYNLAHCYVHPARSEGFGLSAAQAMGAGIPVISLAYAGLADFVSDRTATTISFELEPAGVHLEVPGSVWAEPDGEQLASEMRRMVDEPSRNEIGEKVGRARELLAKDFSWHAVCRRWDTFISELEDAAISPRVAMLSTWNSGCGLEQYTRHLVDNAGDGVTFQIFGPEATEILDPSAEVDEIRARTSRWHPDLSELESAIDFYDPDVVHIQFDFGFFELDRLAELVDRQKEQRGVVMTLHRNRAVASESELLTLGSIKSSLEQLDRLIVRQDRDARALAMLGLTANVSVVPDGAPRPPDITHEEARKVLDLGPRPVVATYGSLLPHVGTLQLIQVVDALRPKFPDICLLAVCAGHSEIRSRPYEDHVRAEIRARGLAHSVMLITDYLPDEVSRTILRAADMIVLPYRNAEESASEALGLALSVERPTVVTDEPIFADCRNFVLTVDPCDLVVGVEDALRRVITDVELQRDLAARASAGARRFRWSRIGTAHREIYTAARRAHLLKGNRQRPLEGHG